MANINVFAGLEEEAKEIYQLWLANRGFDSRHGQIEMIDFLAGMFTNQSEKRIGVVEAGTGTGKTIAYCIPNILAAKKLNKTVVIATSTVLLQEQLLNAELKELAELIPGGFTYGLLKGRNRYACIERIDAQANPTTVAEPDIFEKSARSDDQETAQQLQHAFDHGGWDGNMDKPPVPLDSHQNQSFTTDARGCVGFKCRFRNVCPYFEARDRVVGLDVVVVNYSLLMTFLRTGIDALPAPEDCLYVFDEAHKLEEIVTSTGALRCNEGSAERHAKDSRELTYKLSKYARGNVLLSGLSISIEDHASELIETAKRFNEHIHSTKRNPPDVLLKTPKREEILRFSDGLVASTTRSFAQQVARSLGLLEADLREMNGKLNPQQENGQIELAKNVQRQAALRTSRILQEVEATRALFDDWSNPASNPAARWMDVSQQQIPFCTVPIDIDDFLLEEVWTRAYSATCTSATLVSSNGFDHFKQSVGLSFLADSKSKKIISPFNYAECVEFNIPEIGFDMPGGPKFNKYAAKFLPELLDDEKSALVLFTSRRDMNDVYGNFSRDFQTRCLVQDGNKTVANILTQHRQNVDKGEPSVIMGLVSFREGVDLPGAYCEHVVIMRLPFNPPGDPVQDAKKENLGLTGQDSFMSYDVPATSMKLAQACGRLIRSEQDSGRITVLDSRLRKKFYGRELMKVLPDYRMLNEASLW